MKKESRLISYIGYVQCDKIAILWCEHKYGQKCSLRQKKTQDKDNFTVTKNGIILLQFLLHLLLPQVAIILLRAINFHRCSLLKDIKHWHNHVAFHLQQKSFSLFAYFSFSVPFTCIWLSISFFVCPIKQATCGLQKTLFWASSINPYGACSRSDDKISFMTMMTWWCENDYIWRAKVKIIPFTRQWYM